MKAGKTFWFKTKIMTINYDFLMPGKRDQQIVSTVTSSSYIIIGCQRHNVELPLREITTVAASLEGIIALKMEGEPDMFKLYHPFSAETIVKAAVGRTPVSYIPDPPSDIALQYGVLPELAEVFFPIEHLIRRRGCNPEQALEVAAANPEILFEIPKKKLFPFINPERGMENFQKVIFYWIYHDLNPLDLLVFSEDFQKYYATIREYEFWRKDLQQFRTEYDGKVAIFCGDFHIPFVKAVLDGKKSPRPVLWKNHLNVKRETSIIDRHVSKEEMGDIYRKINRALEL